MDNINELDKLFREAQRRLKPESHRNHRKWLAYCLGVMSAKMDKTDFEAMREGIKKYEV